MVWIKANKTQLYKLVAKYIFLPKLKYTSFIEAPDRSYYCLEWFISSGTHYRAFYLVVNGVPRIAIQYKDKHSEIFNNHTVCRLDIEKLANLGMIRGARSGQQIRNMVINQQLHSVSTSV